MSGVRFLTSVLLLGLLAEGCATPAGVLRVRDRLRRGSIASALDVYERLRRRGRPEAGEALREIAGATVVRAALESSRDSRDAAFGALAGLGEDASPLYERILQRGAEAARARAAEGLLLVEDDAGARVLRRALQSPDGEVRAAGVSLLESKKRWRRIRSLTLDIDSAVRAKAIRALGGAPKNEQTIGCLRDALRLDPSPAVRSAAARSIASVGAAALDALVSALADDSMGVRAAALTALARLRLPAALDRVERVASGEATAEGAVAAGALASAGEESGIAYLRRSMRSGDAELRAQAVAAGGHLGALREEVGRLLDDPEPRVRLRAALALRRDRELGRKAAVVLRALLAEGGSEALQAALALAEERDTRARRRLRDALSSENPSERVLAVQALGERLGEPLTVRRSLLDPNVRVRVSAARAILR